MKTGSVEGSRRPKGEPAAGALRLTRWGATLLLVLASACGPAEAALEPGPPRTQPQDLNTTNGLSLNGLSTAEFTSWFQTNPELNDTVMRYVVLCAAPTGVLRTYTSPSGQTYVWAGSLGLAPDWTHGAPATLVEQRLISACLAAHANKYGRQISLSVLGLSATGVAIPYTLEELLRFYSKEACFFGNLFTPEGLYVGNDGRPLNDRESTARACALSTRGNMVSQECPPLVRVEQDCARFCTLDASRMFYVSCTYNGILWPAITTRMLGSDIYTCGDGICQFTERCGTGETYDNCGRDCGPCP